MQIGKRLQGKVDPADLVQEIFLSVQKAVFAVSRHDRGGVLSPGCGRIMAGQFALVLAALHGNQGAGCEFGARFGRGIRSIIDGAGSGADGFLQHAQPACFRGASRRVLLLAEALGKLSEDHREVIVLRHLEALSFAEVAVRMNRTENSVYKLWVRALGNLRSAMGRRRMSPIRPKIDDDPDATAAGYARGRGFRG